MNIQQAKDYIKQTVRIYLKKDEFGEYEIPVVRQRPVFLLGAPGLGKTAIMEQIAEELSVALVSYSMTHHTRQSALGLPFIKHKVYDGQEVDVSEYTMSEIIATIYETMEESGVKEGILFLDEINCVSETLAPSMLQFLQYKVFGRHQVPDGWVIVTAGNPPEYNKSVREFDVVVMDRLKVLEIESDYKVFKDYAMAKGLHPAIISFLNLKPDNFYRIENSVTGRNYVTARGWEDLSEMIKLYEAEKLEVNETLASQYIHNAEVTKEFAAYYELYNKYKRDYGIEDILRGIVTDETIAKASKATFDERLSLMGMLMDRVISDIRDVIGRTDYLAMLAPIIKSVGGRESSESKKTEEDNGHDDSAISQVMLTLAENKRKQLKSLQRAGALSKEEETCHRRCIRFLENTSSELLKTEDTFDTVKRCYNEELALIKESSALAGKKLHYVFDFIDRAFADGNEMLIFVTEMTVNPYTSKYVARFGSDDYLKYQKELMLTDRATEIKDEVAKLLKEDM